MAAESSLLCGNPTLVREENENVSHDSNPKRVACNDDDDDDDCSVPPPILPLREFSFVHSSSSSSSAFPPLRLRIKSFEVLPPSDALGLLVGDDATGMLVWQGSARLAQFLVDQQQQQHHHHDAEATIGCITSTTIVELGCGVGLLGIVAARVFSAVSPATCRLFLTDRNQDCVATASENCSLNKISNCTSRVLNWGKLTDEQLNGIFSSSPSSSSSFAAASAFSSCSRLVILAADVLYSSDSVVPLCDTVCSLGKWAAASAAAVVSFYFCFYPRSWEQRVNHEMLLKVKELLQGDCWCIDLEQRDGPGTIIVFTRVGKDAAAAVRKDE